MNFQEADHRKIFSRTKLEDSCLHGFYVIGQSNKRSSGTQSDEKTSLPVSILTQGKQTLSVISLQSLITIPNHHQSSRLHAAARSNRSKKRCCCRCWCAILYFLPNVVPMTNLPNLIILIELCRRQLTSFHSKLCEIGLIKRVLLFSSERNQERQRQAKEERKTQTAAKQTEAEKTAAEETRQSQKIGEE